jgi:DNA-binding transcriptional ArsR family regulator
MSVQAISWAYNLRGVSSGQKFVLVTLCNRADEDWSCYPSISFIAEETGMSQRSVRAHLDGLEAAGMILRDRTRNSDGTLGRYRYFVQRQNSPVAKSARGEIKEKQPAANPANGRKRLQPVAKSAALSNRQLEPSDKNTLNEQFEALWSAWPAQGRQRSKAKAKVLEQFRACASKHDPEQILNASRRWLRGQAPEFVPALDRFLRDGRYEHGLPQGNVVALPTAAPDWSAAIRAWLDNRGWPPELGPRPHEAGYTGPLEPIRALIAGKDPDHPVIAVLLAKLAAA